jgi:hypothetical protein
LSGVLTSRLQPLAHALQTFLAEGRNDLAALPELQRLLQPQAAGLQL